MAKFFSASKLAFYDSTLSGSVPGSNGLPSDAQVVTEADYLVIQTGLAQGKALSATSKGAPELAAGATMTLADQAASAYSAAVSKMWSDYGVLNEATPAAWVTYLKSLKALLDGSDTTSTALPAAPDT